MSGATYTITAPLKPALTPPPGVIPNFQQPYTLLPYVELTIAGGIAITTILVAARVFVKVRLMKKWLWEDSTCIFGWVGTHLLTSAFCFPIKAAALVPGRGRCLQAKKITQQLASPLIQSRSTHKNPRLAPLLSF